MPRLVNQLIGAQTIAAAGSSQSDATPITSTPPSLVHVTGADATVGVILPNLSVTGRGRVFFIKNDDTANAVLKVYPAVGNYINALTVNSAFSQAATLMVAFVASDDGLTWYTLSQTTVSTTPASVTSTGAIKSSSSSGGVGYATGAGGAVTQATNKSTGVTLSKVCGAITMNNAELADGDIVSFTVTCTVVATGDQVLVMHASAGTGASYLVWADSISNGASYKINVQNISGGNLSEAIVLNVMILKGVAA